MVTIIWNFLLPFYTWLFSLCIASLVAFPFRICCLEPWFEAVLSVLYCLDVVVVAAAAASLPQSPPPPPLQLPSAKGVGGDNCSSPCDAAASNNLVVDTDAAAFTFSVGIDRY